MKYLLIILLVPTLLVAQRTITTELTKVREEPALDDIDTTGKTEEQIETERIAAFRVADTTTAKRKHRRARQEDAQEDAARPNKPFPGRQPGIRVRLWWPGTPALRQWKQEFQGPRKIGRGWTFEIGACRYGVEATYDAEGNELTPASGRRWTEVKVPRRQIHWLLANGVNVSKVGTWNGNWRPQRDNP